MLRHLSRHDYFKKRLNRELFEESELTVTEEQLKLAGIIQMNFVNKPEQYEVHVFGCDSEPEGQPTETEGVTENNVLLEN